ncbi:MAG: putative reverse transcriptase, partial [Streblomastix strix]
MITAPQEKEERIGELIYKEKIDGMGGRTKRFRQTWEQIGKREFINTGFYLRFKEQNSQQKLEEDKMMIPFRGTQEEKEAYQEMMKEELEEGIVVPIQENQVKWWNHTFLIKKPNGTWRKILDASKLNKEIEKLHFKMHGLEEVQYLANQMDYATSLDLKSAFHHITVSPNSIPYLEFNFNNNNYAYKAMPFGTKHSPIFFAEAIESVLRQIRIHSEIKILNYCDDILLIHQNKQILKTQTMEIMKTLEQFGWTISIDKCEIEPKQVITEIMYKIFGTYDFP